MASKASITELVENMAERKKKMFPISFRSRKHKLRRKRSRITLEEMLGGVSITVEDGKLESSFFLLCSNVEDRLSDISAKMIRIMRKRDVDVVIVE